MKVMFESKVGIEVKLVIDILYLYFFYIDRSSLGSSPLGSNARTIATTSLTAAQLQQLAASRGSQVLSALQSQLKSGNLAYSYTIY